MCFMLHVRPTENEANFIQIHRIDILSKKVQVSPSFLAPDPVLRDL